MGYVKMHGFHGNLLYDFREWGVGLQIQSSRVLPIPKYFEVNFVLRSEGPTEQFGMNLKGPRSAG